MKTDRNIITTYKEWLGLDKKEFRILILIALNNNTYKTNLSEICRKFNLSTSSRNKDNIKNALEKLTNENYINSEKSGYTYTLSIIPKAQEIKAQKSALEHLFSVCGVGVSAEIIIKTYLWYSCYGENLCTNKQIANDLSCSTDTVSNANTFLQKENAVMKNDEIICENNRYKTKGHTVILNVLYNPKK